MKIQETLRKYDLTKEGLTKTIPYEMARRAFHWNSFSPDERAKQTVEDFATIALNLYEKLKALDISRIEEIVIDMEVFIDRYSRKYKDWLSAKSRTASAAVTGPAKFPTERNRKRLDIEFKRLSEMNEWREKAEKSLIKKYKIVPKIEVQQLFDEYIKTINSGEYSKTLMKKGLERRLMSLAKEGRIEDVRKGLENNPDVFTKKHGIYSNLNTLQLKKAVECNEEWIINGVRVVDNVEENRIQLYFDGKPDNDILKYIKNLQYKWTPSKGCWQNWRGEKRLDNIKKYFIEKGV